MMNVTLNTASVYDRLNAFFVYVTKQQKMMKVEEFYNRTGITNGYFRAANKKQRDEGIRKDVNVGTLLKVLNVFSNANLEYFVYGKGSFFLEEGQEYQEKKVVVISDDPSKGGRPYYNVDFLGGFDEVYNDQTIIPTSYINIPEYNRDNYVWVNLTGHSMHPVIQSGDKICICEIKDITSIIYGEIYAIVTEEMRTVKYVTRSELKDHIRLVPENKSACYGDYQDIPLSNIRKMFRVVGSVHLF